MPSRLLIIGSMLLALLSPAAMSARASADQGQTSAGLEKSAGGAGSDKELGPSQEHVFFRAQKLPTTSQTDVTAIAERAVLRAFLNEHPNYDIEAFNMPDVQGKNLDTGPLMAIAAGMPPHAMYVNFRQSSTYITHGFLTPMEVTLARLFSDNPQERQPDGKGGWRADPTQAEIKDALKRIHKRAPDPIWPVMYRPDTSGRYSGKHVWALPLRAIVKGLLYRKDLFLEAGLDPQQPPRTWKELLKYARALREPDKQQYGIGLVGQVSISYGTYSFLVSSGARAIRQNKQGKWRAAYGTRNAAGAVYYVWRLARQAFRRDGRVIHRTAYVAAGPDVHRAWNQGRIGMIFGYLDQEMISSLNPQLVGIAPVPKSPQGKRASELNGPMLGIFSGSTPRQKLAVMRYLWFITGDKAQRIRVQTYIKNGFGKFVSPNLLRKFGHDRLLEQVPKGWQQAFDTALAHGVPEPYGKNTQNIYRFMSRPINTALELPLSQMSRKQGLRKIQNLLEQSARRVDRKVFGEISPSQMRFRRIVASIVLAVIVFAFTLGMYHVWRYFTLVAAPVAARSGWRKFVWGYVLLMPGLLLVLFWMYMPLLGGLGMTFTDYQLVKATSWVGVDNFASVLFNNQFWLSLARTFYYMALVVGLGFWPPILLAVLLDEVPTETLKYFFRTVVYLPAVVSGVIIMFLWRQMYDPSPQGTLNQLLLSFNGLGPVLATIIKWVLLGLYLSLVGLLAWLPITIHEMSKPLKAALWAAALALLTVLVWPVVAAGLGGAGPTGAAAGGAAGGGGLGAAAGVLANLVGSFHLEPLRWIASPGLAMVCVVIPIVWATSGPHCILYLAALKTVPNELYEAADIDGAGVWQKIFYITLPRLKFLIIIQFIAAVIAAFKGGTNYILALTGGGPNGATMILALKIFFQTFLQLDFGAGTAMAWILGALLIGFTAYQLKMLSRAEFRGGR